MVSERIELTLSSPKSSIVTILLCSRRPSYYLVLFIVTRATHRAHMHSTRAGDTEVVVTDDGPQPPIKQLAFIAVHLGPATRAWSGPLLLVLLLIIGGVVTLFVFCACCRMSRFLGCASAKKHKTSEI